MKTKPVNPYQRLVNDARGWIWKALHGKRVHMFTYPEASKASAAYRLDELYQRVVAAGQLGYRVELKSLDGALRVEYVKLPPDPPYPIDPAY